MLVDRRGTPLAVCLSGAHVHDSQLFESLLTAVVPIQGPCGQPRKRPNKLHADKGYDYRKCRQTLHRHAIKVRIARRGKENKDRLGRYSWAFERTLAWLNQFRRLRICYERRADMHLAFVLLGCTLITFNAVNRFC